MLTKFIKVQLVAFAIIGLLAIVYVGANYARLDKMLGFGQYPVTIQMGDSSGGIFTNAQVTYRGVPVGQVGELSLTDKGVNVELKLDSRGPKIPATAVAVVANRSAVGEQFIDLQPTSATGPYLNKGSVITDYQLPPVLQDVMTDVITLTESVPVDDLTTVVDELGKAFDGQAENMDRLVNSLIKLTKAGHDDLGETISLIQNSNVVLGTQAAQSDEILNWAKGLELVTAQLASSDADVRRILTNAPMTASQLSSFIQKHGDDATTLIHQLGVTMKTIEPASFTTGMTMAMLSALSAGSHSPAPGDGQIHFGIVLETNDPPTCTKGYEGTAQIIAEMKRRNPDFDVNYDEFPLNREANCQVAVGNPTGVRSANRAKLANPDYPQPWDNTLKKDPDKLNLNPLATQLAWLTGVHPTKYK
ncbi:Mce family protein [Gordonia hirsuta DSM 44140 = NBRC 16056]|uniref:Mce family protein n=1 Tax=Gordonia hirsuta DSM 44140 = NBRC 16056 TaxID=1121927 RepID=L7L5Z3_9ACTN|nr:MlaD family protein [Gordonia hirsuta]GAC56550.1 Mce family protein [Gordonia hirsuta DSM 44140 = NBRC 16056]